MSNHSNAYGSIGGISDLIKGQQQAQKADTTHKANMAIDTAKLLREEVKRILNGAADALDTREIESLMHLAQYLLDVTQKLEKGHY